LTSKIKDSEAEVRELLTTVPGFRMYGLVDTGSGAFSITVCDDQAGCNESTRRAAGWVKHNLPDANIAPPQIIEGSSVVRIAHRVAPGSPHVILRLFKNSPPTLFSESEAEIREMMTGVSGFGSYNVIDTGTGGASITVCDDKAGTDGVAQVMVPWVRAKLPDVAPPQVIEGEGVLRFTAEGVPA
jgi:hypothetical protein